MTKNKLKKFNQKETIERYEEARPTQDCHLMT